MAARVVSKQSSNSPPRAEPSLAVALETSVEPSALLTPERCKRSAASACAHLYRHELAGPCDSAAEKLVKKASYSSSFDVASSPIGDSLSRTAGREHTSSCALDTGAASSSPVSAGSVFSPVSTVDSSAVCSISDVDAQGSASSTNIKTSSRKHQSVDSAACLSTRSTPSASPTLAAASQFARSSSSSECDVAAGADAQTPELPEPVMCSNMVPAYPVQPAFSLPYYDPVMMMTLNGMHVMAAAAAVAAAAVAPVTPGAVQSIVGCTAVDQQQAGAADDSDDVECAVCALGESFDDNAIVLCDKCELAVHQDCYGILDIPPGDEPWLCEPCAHGECVVMS